MNAHAGVGPPVLFVGTLNGFRLTWCRQAVPSPSAVKARLVLVRLALETRLARVTTREWLWPESDPEQSATNLRKLLHDLRQCGDWVGHAFDFSRDGLSLRPGVAVCVDVVEAIRGLPDVDEIVPWPDVLPGIQDPWVDSLRSSLRDAVFRVLAEWDRQGQSQRITAALHRLIPRVPLDEPLSLWRVRLASQQGDFTAVRTEVSRLRSAVAAQLSTVPSEEYEEELRALAHSSPVDDRSGARWPFVGRRDGLVRLQAQYVRARKEGALAVWIEGDPGIGKSRLVAEFVRHRMGTPSSVIWLACQRFDRDTPYAVLAQSLRERDLAGLENPWRMEVARILPEWAAPGEDPPALTTPWRRQRFHYAISRAVLGPVPGIIVLDNAQWLDRHTARWWQGLPTLPTLRHALFVIICRPPADDRERQRIRALGDAWATAGRLVTLDVPPLTLREVAQLSEHLGQPRDDGAAALIAALSRGSPLKVIELARGLQSEPAASTTALEWESVVRWRLKRLPASARTLVERLALLQESPVSLDRAVAVGGQGPAAVLRDIATLVDAGVVSEDYGQRVCITHDLIRDIIAESVSPHRAQVHHAQIARAFHEDAADGTHLLLAARHYEAAGLSQLALEHSVAALQTSERQGNLELALAAVTEQERLTPPTSRRPVALKRAEILLHLGRFNEVQETADGASVAALAAGEWALYVNAEILAAQSLLRRGHWQQAAARLAVTAESARMHGDQVGQLRIFEVLASLQYESGDLTAAAATAQQLAARARRLQEPELAAQALNMLGLIDGDQGRYADAIRRYGLALQLINPEQHREGVITLLGNLGNGYTNAGRYGDACVSLARRLRLCRAWGYRAQEATTLGNVAAALMPSGQYGWALRAALGSLEGAARVGDRSSAAWALFEASLAFRQLGHGEAGRRVLGHAVALAEAMGAHSLLARFRLRQAAFLYFEQHSGALATARSAESVAETIPRPTIVARARLLQILVEASDSSVSGARLAQALATVTAHPGWQTAWAPLVDYVWWKAEPTDTRQRAARESLRQAWATRPHWSFPDLYREVTGGAVLPPCSPPDIDPSLLPPLPAGDVVAHVERQLESILTPA